MRLPNPTLFPLKIELRSPDLALLGLELRVFDSDLAPYHSRHNAYDTIHWLELDVAPPQKIIIKLSISDDRSPVELTNFDLAGIKVSKDKLLNCLEYRPNPLNLAVTDAQAIFDLPISQTLTWSQPGYVIINLFHPNPFAWHLYIGNTIRF